MAFPLMLANILGGVGQGVGGAGRALEVSREEERRQAATAEQQRHNRAIEGLTEAQHLVDVTPDVVNTLKAGGLDLSPFLGKKIPTSVYNSAVTTAEKVGAENRERQERGAVSDLLAGARGTPGTPSDVGPRDETGEPNIVPGTTGTPGMSMDQVRSALAKYKIGPAIFKDMYPQDKYAAGERGVLNTTTGKFEAFPETPVPPVAPGFARTTTYDKSGRPSYSDKPHEPKPERTLSERFAEAELRFKANPNDPQARDDYNKTKLAFQNEEKLAGLRASGAADARPLPEGTAQAIATHDNILASAQLLKTFTPEEIKTYSGLLNRPIQDVRQVLSGIAPSVFGDPDQRFADFKALMGRLEGTAFGEGGKQLTGIELAVIRNYTPNGREPGGAAEMQAKIKNLEAFTRLARNSRVKLAQTGRADVTPDMLDGMIRDEMQRAGLPLPGQAPGTVSLGGPAGVGNTTATPQTQPPAKAVEWTRDANGRPVPKR